MREYDAFDEFVRNTCERYGITLRDPPKRAKLVAVTADNAELLQQMPKRRGRPPNVSEGGNVVALRPPERPQGRPSDCDGEGSPA